jgi:hypothetical protein
MRYDHIAHSAALALIKGNADTARINGNAFVDQKASQALRLAGAPIGIKRAG